MPAKRVYVGNLPPDVRDDEVKDLFRKYGNICFMDLKNRGAGPPFAFVDFDDDRDAEDAVRARDGYDWDGFRLRVEFPRGVGPRGPGGRPEHDRGGDRGGYGGRDRYDDRDRGYGGGRGGGGGGRGGFGGPPRRSQYRCLVSGLPPTGSWQDLKDHLRNAGEIFYADVFRDGNGAVEFASSDGLRTAMRKFDDTKFRSHEGETSYIRLKEDGGDRGGGGRGRSRSRSRSRTPRSRSRSPRRSSRRSPSYDRGSPRRRDSRSRSARSRSARSRTRSRSRT